MTLVLNTSALTDFDVLDTSRDCTDHVSGDL